MRKSTNWEKIFVKQLFDKELISITHKEILKLINEKTSNPIKKQTVGAPGCLSR